MLNSISYFLRSAWEIAGQFPKEYGGVDEKKQPVSLTWDKLPLTPLCGYPVPRDLIHFIFNQLPPEELFTVRMVCRLWHQMASTNLLTRLFPRAPFWDKKAWEEFIDLNEHGLVFGKIEEPKVTMRYYIETKRMASQVEPNPRIHPIGIIDLPEGLTPNKIIAFAQAPKRGNKTSFQYMTPNCLEKYGNMEIKKTIRVIVTNGVFKESRVETVKAQEKRVKDLTCDMPEMIPFMANIILTFIRSDPDNPLRLFGDNPWTYTRCVEEIDGYKIVVGGFAPAGPDVRHIHSLIGSEYCGVSGLRKFPAIGN